jgi:hypothetical protein
MRTNVSLRTNVPRVGYFTGACEILGAVGLGVPRWWRLAGIMLAIYFVCVFPANIQNAVQRLAVGSAEGAMVFNGCGSRSGRSRSGGRCMQRACLSARRRARKSRPVNDGGIPMLSAAMRCGWSGGPRAHLGRTSSIEGGVGGQVAFL